MADLISFGDAPSGTAYASVPVKAWRVEHVVEFLEHLQLNSLVPAIKENAVDGVMLLELSDAELETDLGFRPLQIKKVKRELEALTNKPAVAAAAPAPAPVAVHIAAAAPVATVPDTAAREAEEAKAKAEAKAEEEAKAKAAYQAKAAQDSQAAQAQAQRYAAAARLLGAADQHLQAAMKNLNEALKAQAVNTGIGIGERGRDHGFMHRRNEPAEMVTAAAAHKHCEGAKQLSEMASQEINQARVQCPELPPIRVPDVAVVGGIVMQGLFDSTMADAMRMSKIKGALQEMARCEGEVRVAMQKCGTTAQAAQGQAQAAAYAASGGASAAPAPAAPPPAGYPPAAGYGYPPAPAYGYPPAPGYDGYTPPPAPAAVPAATQGRGMGVGGALLLGAAIGDHHRGPGPLHFRRF